MRNKYLIAKAKISVVILTLIFFACRPEKKKQFSNWKIKGTEYSSNNTEVAIGHAIGKLSCSGKNRFSITFYSFSFMTANSLPDTDSFLLTRDNLEQDSGKVLLYLYIDTTGYVPPTNSIKYLKAERINGKIRYTLPGMWYVNYMNPNDSVLVEGTFNEP
ncbi:hypothetical protein DBR32_15160 [Taibaiella sp. KBW10]|uniref:hypothetical protein n=1 Tax=Taibaiella sp. KBW10 TaxID=2153357 RepID=UPI000F5B6233|nr:hypothetical protein [Taibaiella sp. KBW10]RQO29912.1 hypothetical protein DBR32_15160 [Taibaiella sp. KBW10]